MSGESNLVVTIRCLRALTAARGTRCSCRSSSDLEPGNDEIMSAAGKNSATPCRQRIKRDHATPDSFGSFQRGACTWHSAFFLQRARNPTKPGHVTIVSKTHRSALSSIRTRCAGDALTYSERSADQDADESHQRRAREHPDPPPPVPLQSLRLPPGPALLGGPLPTRPLLLGCLYPRPRERLQGNVGGAVPGDDPPRDVGEGRDGCGCCCSGGRRGGAAAAAATTGGGRLARTGRSLVAGGRCGRRR